MVATIRGEGIGEEPKTFSTFTSALKELSQWLKTNGITHIAMESTGVYWKPVYNMLDPDFELILVNARHIRYVPGHKTEVSGSPTATKP